MKKRCLCSGSFDPVTFGHLDIIRRAAGIFDEVTVAVLDSASKTYMFTREQRLEMARASVADLPNVRATSFDGLLVDLLKKEEITTVVRGIRGSADLQTETQVARANKLLMPACETLFLAASEEYSFISSTIVRELIRFQADISQFAPPAVVEMARRKGNFGEDF